MEENLNERERHALKNMFDTEPNEAVRTRLVTQLKHERIIGSNQRKLSWPGIAASVAIGIVAFGLGWLLANFREEPQYTYLMVLHEPTGFDKSNNGSKFKEYGAWASALQNAGVAVTGEKLSTEKYLVGATQTPKNAVIEPITGFFMISASSLENAREIASNSPHVKYGGLVELRKIVRE